VVPSMAFCNSEEFIVAKLGILFCNFVRFYFAINNFILNIKFLFELSYRNEIKFYITLDVRRYYSNMTGSIFKTIRFLILINIFLLPFVIAVQNVIIRFVIGLFLGFSFIVLLSFSSKLQNLYKKNK
jgi:phosphoglycerol transferase MdoB-like AlkP superfamily enzyme